MASIQRQEEYYKLNSERKIETEEARVFIENRDCQKKEIIQGEINS